MHRSIRQPIVYLFRNANCQFMQLIPGVATTTTQSSDHIYYKLYNNNNSNNIIISPRPQKQKIKNKCRDNIARVFCCICNSSKRQTFIMINFIFPARNRRQCRRRTNRTKTRETVTCPEFPNNTTTTRPTTVTIPTQTMRIEKQRQ